MEEDILKILVVEDNPGDYRLLRETLREMGGMAYELFQEESLQAAKKTLSAQAFNVVLLDLNLPDGNGLANISEISPFVGEAPILIMTGLDDEMMAVEALRKGAQDYLVKGSFAADVFWRAVRYAVERKRIDEKLKQAKETAEAGIRAKSEFLAHMSHEIRTPLNVILGLADLLADSELNEQQKEYVDRFKTSGKTLLNLINGILDLSKAEAGKMEVESIPFDLRALVQDICKFMSVAAESRGNVLTAFIDPRIPDYVMGDPQRLQQVIFNLLGNAIKFTDQGKVHLEAHAEGTQMRLSVQDSGIGIEAGRINDIFGEFRQAGAQTFREFGGSGLGLSICAKLVALWKGKIWAESVYGKGSRFQFTFPLLASIQNAPEKAGEEPSEVDLPTAVRAFSQEKPMRVLAVDDHQDNLMLLTAYLKHPAVDLTTARDGRTGFETFCKFAFDVVLLDMQMPVQDGYETARQIRRWELEKSASATPVIAITAYASEEDRRKCLEAGCSGFLLKPLRKETLFTKIQTLFPAPTLETTRDPQDTELLVDQSLKEIIPDYLKRKAKESAQIIKSLEAKKFKEIEVIGHNLLGTGTPYGFAELSRLGGIIEEAALERKEDRIRASAQELSQYLKSLKVTFQ